MFIPESQTIGSLMVLLARKATPMRRTDLRSALKRSIGNQLYSKAESPYEYMVPYWLFQHFLLYWLFAQRYTPNRRVQSSFCLYLYNHHLNVETYVLVATDTVCVVFVMACVPPEFKPTSRFITTRGSSKITGQLLTRLSAAEWS